ncbi:urease subunit beta [Solwaraspora sp. WMMD406]|uniref:urease subunit beta n=1 Tax=Solwaraspora sp. WMMD406 TaxID=3016095 RepID=UPI002415EA2A|nr:urease subunit beta [Solwaraspora sp. WMMD406]MDG4766518.1 urease subunit beta [Solwaraspora sp. WMMD406]
MSAPPTPSGTDGGPVVPGEVIPGDRPIVLNSGRPVLTLAVVNTGDRPVQVGSHYHFAEANPALDFDRAAAWGHRLAVAAGTSVRFEPGVDREVTLVPFGGRRIVAGLRGECAGELDGRGPATAAGTDEAGGPA